MKIRGTQQEEYEETIYAKSTIIFLYLYVCRRGTGDPLSQVNKHIMLRNGAFEFDDIPNTICLCGHSVSEHLIDLDGIADCCLFSKGDVCICDKFLDKGSKIIMPQKQDGRLPKRVKEEILTTGEINSYIQTLSKM